METSGTQVRDFYVGLKKDVPFALLAFFIWGGWTFVANVHAGIFVATVSAVAQGSFSLLMTFFMGYLTVFIFHRMSMPWARLLMPSFLILLLAAVGLSLLHHVIGTPEILKTIVPALAVGYGFCFYKTIQLIKEAK